MLLGLVWAVAPLLPGWTILCVTCYLTVRLLIGFAFTFLSSSDTVLPHPHAPAQPRVAEVIGAVMTLAPGIAGVGIVLSNAWTPTGVDLRIAVLVAAVLLLLEKLGVNSPPHLGAELRRIRRDVAFGRLSAPAALRQAEIALEGLDVDAAIEPELRAFLSALEQCDRAGTRMEAAVAALRKLEKDTDEPSARAERLQSSVQECKAAMADLKRLSLHLQPAADRFFARQKLLLRWAPAGGDDLVRLGDLLANAIRESSLSDRFDVLIKEVADFTALAALPPEPVDEVGEELPRPGARSRP